MKKRTRPRKQSTQFKDLLEEYKELRKAIFGDSKFAVVNNSPQQKRYDQLLAFFYPCFRTKYWINPLNEKKVRH